MFITTTRPNDALIEQLLPILEEASQILLQEYQNYSAGYEFTIEEKHDDSP
nr:3'(2'),5'-bisphosphate nucleotidase CysQ [Acinetobacter baumannii]